ncbi:MAG: hypothetical protein Q8P12_01540, partial [bacterium]|nr:hypothetical protein [bacterium]
MDQGTLPDAAKRVIPEDTMNKTNEISNHHHNSQSRKEEILLLIMLLPTDKQGLAYESFMASVKRLFTALLESRHYDMWREFFTDA